MRKTRKCAFCGREFTCNSGSQRYCSEHCAEAAKAQRKKKQQDFLRAVQPVIDIASQEYLTFSKVAILMGCSRQYVYKLVNEGKLPASRISSRMSFIRKADIEKMLAGNPYHRVLHGALSNKSSKKSSHSSSFSLSSKKDKTCVPETSTQTTEPLDYISGEDVMATYKVKKSWLYASAKRNNIPMCKIAGKNYYSRKHMDALFGVTAEIEALTEWLTTEEAETLYSTTKESLRTQAYRRQIPTKREYGRTYYSKIHLDEVYHPDLKASDAYYTTTEAAEKYGMTKSNIGVIARAHNITKVKVGVHNLIAKEELDRIMASRLARFGAYRLQ
ncbi:MAG: helix-turn-helix domain-containing protein [Muribaculaceae bacterium]|nr:helix-turn-helix domain-containing protein [Muribaculaceae bacterium]